MKAMHGAYQMVLLTDVINVAGAEAERFAGFARRLGVFGLRERDLPSSHAPRLHPDLVIAGDEPCISVSLRPGEPLDV